MKKLFLFFVAVNCLTTIAYAQSGQSDFKPVYISKTPQPKAPANLVITDMTFSDRDGNSDNILDADETGEISFLLTNKGSGDAYNLVIQISEQNRIEGISFNEKQFGDNLAPGKSKKIKIPVSGSHELTTGKAKFGILVLEANHFNADPAEISFNTQSFRNPLVKIAAHQFSNKETEGKIGLAQIVNLKMVVQNKGQGIAKNINVTITNPPDVFAVGETQISIPMLKPNETYDINYEFMANKVYKDKEIPISVDITESYGKYGEKETESVSLEETLPKTIQIDIDAQRQREVMINEVTLNSDVDRDIPENKKVFANRYALIIGNEDYSKYQPGLNSEANVEFASNDAKAFREYCNKTMGIPEENIYYHINATAGPMNQEIDKLNKIIKNTNGEAEVFFYYAGHGLPDEQSKDAYIIPVDVSGTDMQSAIKLQTLYSKLTEFPSKRVTVFLDACFTGGGRNQGLVAARMIKTKPTSQVINGNVIVFTASSGVESSLPWKEKQHGLFTYCLLKNIQDTKGNITYDELFNNLDKEIKLKSITVNNKEQTPSLLISNELADKWKEWKIY